MGDLMPVQLVATVGRVILGAYFLLGGVAKIFGSSDGGQIAHMAANAIPYAEYLFPLTGACEIIGGLTLLIGLHTRLVSLLLAAFVILVSVKLHAFWRPVEGGGEHEQLIQMIMFLKNMTTFAALLAFIGFGPGPLAVDNLYGKKGDD
jgi:putative oxidoreductase